MTNIDKCGDTEGSVRMNNLIELYSVNTEQYMSSKWLYFTHFISAQKQKRVFNAVETEIRSYKQRPNWFEYTKLILNPAVRKKKYSNYGTMSIYNADYLS